MIDNNLNKLNNLNSELETVKIYLSKIIKNEKNKIFKKLYDETIKNKKDNEKLIIEIIANNKNYIIIADKISNSYYRHEIKLIGEKNGNLIVENNQKYSCDIFREGKGHGHAILIGSTIGDVFRDDEGNGNAIKIGSGEGNASRKNKGDGHAIRSGSGLGLARRVNEGNGNAIKMGSGDGNAWHHGEGDGHAIRSGSGIGDAHRLETENGSTIQSKSGCSLKLGIGEGICNKKMIL